MMSTRAMLEFTAASLVAALGLLLALGSTDCGPPKASQVGAVAEATCTLLEAFAGGPEERAICAKADDLIGMAADVRMARADAAAAQSGKHPLGRKAGQCQIIPTTTVCATDEELAAAIDRRRGTR